LHNKRISILKSAAEKDVSAMIVLLLAALIFLGIHFLVSGTPLRDAVARTIGESPYLGLFSLLSLIGIAWLAVSYNAAEASSANAILYDLGIGVRHAAVHCSEGKDGAFRPYKESL